MALIYLDPTGRLRPRDDEEGREPPNGLPATPDLPPQEEPAPLAGPPAAPAARPAAPQPPTVPVDPAFDPAALERAQSYDRDMAEHDANRAGMIEGAYAAARLPTPKVDRTPSAVGELDERRKMLLAHLEARRGTYQDERMASRDAATDAETGYKHGRDAQEDAYKAVRDAVTDKFKKRELDIEAERARRMGLTGVRGAPGTQDSNAQAIADAIMRGDQPPNTQGLYRYGAAVRAILAANHFNLAKAQGEWTATQAAISHLNSTQQVRLRQAIDNAYHQLDVLEEVYGQWEKVGSSNGIRVFNRAALELAKQKGGEVGAVAQGLEGQIADLTSELANVYMGGGTPTQEALRLAQENLSGAYDGQTFRYALGLVRTNLSTRKSAMLNAGVGGFPGGTRYERDAQTVGSPPHGTEAAPPAGPPGAAAAHPAAGATVRGETLGYPAGTEFKSNGDGTYTRTK